MSIPKYNLTLQDGTVLKECGIYLYVEETGDYIHIVNRDVAEAELQKYPWANQWRKVHFQNDMLNGHISLDMLAKWELVTPKRWDN